jgi:hypothetical protein
MKTNKVTTLTVKCSVNDKINNKEMSVQELSEEYKLIYSKWTVACNLCQKQEKMIISLN